MPQLDTSTWFVVILSTMLTLLILFQLKFSTYLYPLNITPKDFELKKTINPWEKKWTKIYLPLL
uniref:ATP synthase complex subunit 8 n=1 Tax=Graphiurus kelleni TaxID=1223622 RepID=S6CQG2_GRAKE|nr:ATP8 [Graphiurus kelleni]